MDKQITLKYNNQSIVVDLLGAQLMSYKVNNHEVIWKGDKASWMNHAPILFPICGGLNNNEYRLNGKSYPMIKHGFIRNTIFKLVSKGNNYLELMLEANEETKKYFPFDFDFLVRYELGNYLSISYIVRNKSEDDMYFGIGSHEGYQLYDELETYSVRFEKEEELKSNIINGSLIERKTLDFPKGQTLYMKNEYFKIDALVFQNIKSREVTLLHNDKEEVVKVRFKNAKHLVLWTIPGARFLCIEPWTSVHDYINEIKDIKEKEDIICLKPHQGYEFSHIIKAG